MSENFGREGVEVGLFSGNLVEHSLGAPGCGRRDEEFVPDFLPCCTFVNTVLYIPERRTCLAVMAGCKCKGSE